MTKTTWRQHRTRWRIMLACSAVLGGLAASFLAAGVFSWFHAILLAANVAVGVTAAYWLGQCNAWIAKGYE